MGIGRSSLCISLGISLGFLCWLFRSLITWLGTVIIESVHSSSVMTIWALLAVAAEVAVR